MEVIPAAQRPQAASFLGAIEADVKALLPKGVVYGKPIPAAKFQDTILAILTAFEDAGTPVELREKARIRGGVPLPGAKGPRRGMSTDHDGRPRGLIT